MRRRDPLQLLRHVIQAAVVAFMAYLVIRGLIVGEADSTSAEAFCAFGGLEGLYRFLTSGGATLAKTHLSNLIVLAAAVLTTVFAKGFFCGWLCPFGAIQEWLGSLGKVLRLPRLRIPKRIDAALKYVRYLVLATVIIATISASKLIFQAYDPFAALLKIGELGLGVGGAVLALVLIASLFIERPWCRYFCPLGGFLGLVGLVSITRVRRQAGTCISCGRCSRECPMGVDVSAGAAAKDTSCIGCLKCLGSCPVSGALTVGASLGQADAGKGAQVDGD